jgi:hypothetical protein
MDESSEMRLGAAAKVGGQRAFFVSTRAAIFLIYAALL